MFLEKPSKEFIMQNDIRDLLNEEIQTVAGGSDEPPFCGTLPHFPPRPFVLNPGTIIVLPPIYVGP
jgi:hypothetical protein